ncbi:TonB-dependent receptor [Teredinibacter haidensis]|uniref:TonB-dependent receptor n=1 Tax=Teredinibacter haidensis TaxID=2731755 RepID=UPI00163BF331|nr:TonB-dependent receptor [Teredinibacter haidensis]
MTKRFYPPLALYSLVSFAISSTAFAQNEQEEIVVTGELRNIEQLDLANSVSVISEELIESRNAKNLEDILGLIPNVNFSAGASRGRFIQIRGIGERSEFVAPINPSVGVIVDGIDFTGLATGVSGLDASQVEVFRGPQGTLYGANALAGMINVVGNAPAEAAGGKVSAGIGNYGSYDLAGTVTTPLSETVGWRLAMQKNVSDGYIKNDYLDRDDTNNIDELSLRNHLSFDVSKELHVDLISYFVDVDNGYDAFSLDNNRHTLSDEPGHDRQKTFAHALKTRFTGFGFADLNVVLSYADSEVEYGYDEDWSFLDICPADSACAGWEYSSTDNYQRDNNNFSVDLRLASKSQETAVNWVVGAYYRDQDVELIRTYTYDADYNSDFGTRNAALYGQLDIALSDRLNLVTGFRAEDFEADYSDSNNSQFEPSESLWGGKISLEYKTESNALVYGLISRGYKVGSFNPEPSLAEQQKTFDTETMLNYELGLKSSLLNNTLDLQVAGFYQQRNDIQAKQSRALPLDEGFEFIDFLTNAAEGYNYGLETEVNWRVSDNLTLFSSIAILETGYEDFENRSHVDRDKVTGEGYDMSDRAQAHAPGYQYFVAAQYDFESNLYMRVELEGKDSFYFSESHNEKSESYSLLNARLGYDLNSTSFALWAKNLTDETIETRGFYFSHDFGNDPRKFYDPEPYSQKGTPLTFGVSVSHSF